MRGRALTEECRCLFTFEPPAPPVRRALGTFGLPLILEEALAGLELDGVDAALERFHDRSILLEASRVALLAELPEEHGVALLLAGGAFPTLVFGGRSRMVSPAMRICIAHASTIGESLMKAESVPEGDECLPCE